MSIENSPLVTIDSETARDLDDAISVFVRPDGSHDVRVAIANPVGVVRIGSRLDQDAQERGASIYARDYVVRPMLPPAISTNQCSLIQDRERQAIVFDMHLDQQLDVKEFRLHLATIRVAERLSYKGIPAVLGDPAHPAHGVVGAAVKLSSMLLRRRRESGALALYDLTQLLMTSEEGLIVRAESREAMVGNILVQEAMILANKEVGQYMVRNGLPGIFRNHRRTNAAPPSLDLALTVEAWMNSGSLTAHQVQEQFNAVVGRARYESSVSGHYGLSLPVYLHVTSPLRRYADLVNMRQLSAHLLEESLPYDREALDTIAAQLNEVLDQHRKDREDSFKLKVAQSAERRIAAGDLHAMAENEISAAIKLAVEAGKIPQLLEDELIRRADKGLLTLALATRLVFQTPLVLLSGGLRLALRDWAASAPARVPGVVNAGVQIGVLETPPVDVQQDIKTMRFKVRAIFVMEDGTQHEGVGFGLQKRYASQIAQTLAFCALLGVPDVAVIEADGNEEAPRLNAKGALLEWCQKAKVPMPVFKGSIVGESHTPVFGSVVTVSYRGTVVTGKATGAASKRLAEQQASQSLLSQLTALKLGTPTKPTAGVATAAEANPISQLNMWTQKTKGATIDFTFASVPGNPPLFRCSALAQHGGSTWEGVAEAPSKQQAKTDAAGAVLQRLMQ